MAKKNYATALTGIWYQNVINKSVADKKITTSFCQYIIFFSPTSKDENEQEHTIVSTYTSEIFTTANIFTEARWGK